MKTEAKGVGRSHLQAEQVKVEAPELATGLVEGEAPVKRSAAPDPEVREYALRAPQRKFSGEFKRQVVEAAGACKSPGEVGALLRRKGLYWSHLKAWRVQYAAGALAGLAPKTRGRKPEEKNPLAEQVAQLERELRRAQARAERAERLVELQKKVSELLGVALERPDESGERR